MNVYAGAASASNMTTGTLGRKASPKTVTTSTPEIAASPKLMGRMTIGHAPRYCAEHLHGQSQIFAAVSPFRMVGQQTAGHLDRKLQRDLATDRPMA